MPDPPSVNVLTRYLLENPWPAAAVGLVIGGLLLWIGLREGRSRQARAGLLVLVVAVAIVVIDLLVVTAGERADGIARAMVDAAATNDLVKLDALLAPSAQLSAASPRNPGYGKTVILDQASRLEGDFGVESCRVTSLDAYTESSSRATVHLACRTEFRAGLYTTPSQWVVVVERQDDGSWQVTQITCMTIASQAARPEWWR